MTKKAQLPLKEKIGIRQWFAYNEREKIVRAIPLLHDLGITRISTGISWYEFLLPGGKEGFDFLMNSMHDAEIKLHVSICYTPSDITEGNHYTSAPKRLADFADFVETVVKRYQGKIEALHLWNEPNNRHYWDQKNDPGWKKFAEMIRIAAPRVKAAGVKTVLGGLIMGSGWREDGMGWMPDIPFIKAMKSQHALDDIDAIAFHSFPGMWVSGDAEHPVHPGWSWGEPESLWSSWTEKVKPYEELAEGREIIVSESGYSTYNWDERKAGNYDEQKKWILRTAECPVPLFWYSLFDADIGAQMIGGENGTDPRNPHFGIVKADGTKKPAYHALKEMLAESTIPDDAHSSNIKA